MAIDQDFVVRKGLIAQGQTQSYSTVSGTLVVGGGAGFGGNVNLGGTLLARSNPDVTTSINTTTGFAFSLNDVIVTDSTSVETGWSVANYIGQTSINGTTGSVITTAANVYIKGAPIAANSGTTIQNAWSLYITTGSMYLGETKGNPFGATGNALQVAGGISAGNGLFVQGGGNLFGSFYLNDSEVLTRANQNTGTIYFTGELIVDTSTQSISTGTGAIVIKKGGGLGVGGNAYIGGYLAVIGTATILSTQASNSITSGALTLKGGLGVSGQVYASSSTLVGSFSSVSSVNGNTLKIPNGGIGVGGTVYIANTSDSALTVAGGADIAGAVFANSLSLLDSTSATGYLAAPLMVTGGAYIGANLIVGSTETDAVRVVGGIVVEQDITVRGIGSFTNHIEAANTSFVAGAEIITTATVDIFAVTSLTAGTDTAVSASTGPVVVWNTSTLDSVLNRGNATTNTVFINNTLTTVDLGVSGTATITGTVVILNTTQSVSTESGALQVYGGVGIQGALWVNDPSYIGGARVVTTSTLGDYGVTALLAGTDTAINTTTGVVTVWNESTLQTITDRGTETNHQIYFSNTASSTSSDSGAFTVAGGVGIGKELNVGGNSTLTGVVHIASPVNASSPLDGALHIDGGVGIGQDLYVGGQFVYTNALSVYGLLTNYGAVQITSTANAYSTDTGALIVAGGAGFGGDIYAGNIYANGGSVITTGTIGSYGVSQLYAGTDTAVSSASGVVYVWNTSTLDSVSSRGSTTTYAIDIQNTLTVTDVVVRNNVDVVGNITLAAMTATGIVDLQNVSDSISVVSGAVRVAGGVGVQGNVYAGALYDQNARAITTATVNQFAVTELIAGTDTSVSTSTGIVTVWNTSTLQTVTDRGNSTTNAIEILSVSTESLKVSGGVSIQGTATLATDINIGNDINVTNIARLNAVTVSGITTVTNVTNSDSVLTGSVQLTGGMGVQGNIYAGAVYDNDARVVTTATIVGLGVTNLSAGTDTAVSTATGVIVVWNTSTFQTVTDRGNTTTNEIFISNTLTVTDLNVTNNLNVVSSATVDALYAANTSYVDNAEIITTSTLANYSVTKLIGGTDTSVNTSTGEVTVWNVSTLQSVTERGATTNQAIRITDVTPSGSYSEGALVVDGGVGVAGNLYVGQNAFITGNLTVLGTQTIVDSTSTSIVDPVLDIGTGAADAPLVTDDLLNKGISVHYYSTGSNAEDNMFFGRDEPSGKFIIKHEYGSGRVSNPDYSTSGTYAGAILGNLLITDSTSATSTYTGALHVVGGGSVEGDFWIGGTAYIANAEILTTSTIGGFGVTNIKGGDDINVTTSTGDVIISNTSTLQTVTGRGNSTTNSMVILNATESDDISSGALTVTGGVGVGKQLHVGTTATIGTDLFALKVFDNGNRVVTAVEPVAGDSIGITNAQTVGTYTTFTISNLGVTSTFGTTFIGVSTSTGAVTITNLGVTELVGTDYIGVSTSTGSVTLVNLGVQTLTAGTDTVVSANTGTIVVWNESTLDTVASRGHTSTYKIDITNLTQASNYTSGALTVAGGVGIGGNVYINNRSYIQNAEIVTTATIDQFAVTDLRAGTDTSVSASHGIVTVWNTSTLQTVTDRGFTTTNEVHFANTANSISVTTASVVVDGGLSVGKDLRIGGTFFYAGELQIASTTSSTSTNTGALTVVGGVGIGENLNVGGLVHFYNTTTSTSVTTGAVVVDGGIGVSGPSHFGDVYSNGSIVLTDSSFKGVADIRAGTDTAVSTETGHVIVWNTSTLQTVTDRGNSTTNVLHITNLTPSTDATTGALVVDGGVGISGNTYAQTIFVNDTLESIATNLNLNSGVGGSVFANGIDLLAYDDHVIYVSDGTGNDTTGNGNSIQSAYKTIAKALSVALSGDVVFVEAGTYNEVFPLTVPQGVCIKGAGIRQTIIQPTGGTISNDAFLLNGESSLSDFVISGFRKPGWAFKFAPGAKITTKSPYIERVSVITRGSTTSSADPYGYASNDAGNGAYIDAGVLDPTSLEPAMLWNEVTFIVPNATGMYMTNGARAELLNGFFYFANTAIDAQAGTAGFGGVGKTRLKFSNVTGTFVGGDTLVYKGPTGQTISSGTIYSVSGGYVYLNGPVWGFEPAIDRIPKSVTVYGGAKLSTSQKQVGSSSLLISTATDYVEVISGPDFQFGSTQDYTIETYVRALTTGSGTQYIFFKGSNAISTIRLFVDNNNKINASHGSATITSTATVYQNIWTHVAIVRDGTANTLKLYVDGVLSASATGITSSVANTDPIEIGSNGTNYFQGYIDELRISNIARYTASFTPPVSGVTNDSATVLMLHFEGADNSTSITDDGVTVQNISATGAGPGATATRTILADYHQFGAELRCIGSAAVFGDRGVVANGTGTDLKLIAFNLSHIGSGGDLSDDVSLTIQANEITQTNNGKVYYQTVDHNGDFRVGDHFLINQRTGDVTFNASALNLNNISSLLISDGINTTNITPGNIAVGNLNLGGNTIGSLTGNITISPASTLTTIDSNLQVNGSANISQTSYVDGYEILTAGTIGGFGVTDLRAGTDTAVSTSTGNVIVWNTSTLQSITDRGFTTTNRVNIANASNATTSTDGALTVAGGIGVAGDIHVGGNVYSLGGQPLYSPKVSVSLTAPTTATNNIGDFWIDPSIGVEYQWVQDGTNFYWIQFTGV